MIRCPVIYICMQWIHCVCECTSISISCNISNMRDSVSLHFQTLIIQNCFWMHVLFSVPAIPLLKEAAESNMAIQSATEEVRVCFAINIYLHKWYLSSTSKVNFPGFIMEPTGDLPQSFAHHIVVFGHFFSDFCPSLVFSCCTQSWLLLGVEDTGHVTIEHHLTNLLFLFFPCSFVLLFPVVLGQLYLLHQVRVTIFDMVLSLGTKKLIWLQNFNGRTHKKTLQNNNQYESSFSNIFHVSTSSSSSFMFFSAGLRLCAA